MPKDAVGFDMGCGTGRWTQFVAPKITLDVMEVETIGQRWLINGFNINLMTDLQIFSYLLAYTFSSQDFPILGNKLTLQKHLIRLIE